MLHIYNSLTRTKELFKPLIPGKVGLYTCGITVYDHCHLGHARTMVLFDVVVRYLRSLNFQVTYVRNITDIDDKIINRANKLGIGIAELTEQSIQSMHADMAALHILPPDIEPRATAYIDAMVQLIEKLIDKGFAYVSDTGDVCFAVERFASYGKLSNQDLNGLRAGARIDVVTEKHSPLDFVLWKAAKSDEPSWPSPGDTNNTGRPGWHIECSAMGMQTLGMPFDIHGGGVDLQFPHHENEIAQSEAAADLDQPLANYWMHVGMLQINHEKMAKSTGNFLTLSSIMQTQHPEVVRYFLLSSHYRSELNYVDSSLQNASRSLTRLYQSLYKFNLDMACSLDINWSHKFNQAMNDDFNTPEALAVLFELSHVLNKTADVQLATTLKTLGGTLGLLQSAPEDFFKYKIAATDQQRIDRLVIERNLARESKNWAKADEIRILLASEGVEVLDGINGSTWRKTDAS